MWKWPLFPGQHHRQPIPFVDIFILDRCNSIVGGGVRSLPGKLFNKNIVGGARQDVLLNGSDNSSQKISKCFHSLWNKVGEIAHTLLGHI